ncbi:UDP-glycosyltransferase 88B1-like protein [Tanacetum coccineum]
MPPEVVDLNQLLSDEFLYRIKDRGFVVKKWVPQVTVLNHESLGGFVTHCGWNSVLEATRAGVPMDGKVAAEEVEKRVRQLMESKVGKIVKEVVKARKEDAARAMSEGGSSRVALAKLVESWKTTRHL